MGGNAGACVVRRGYRLRQFEHRHFAVPPAGVTAVSLLSLAASPFDSGNPFNRFDE
jgi:hypothetical protein